MNRYGPRIITDALILHLDAADRNSYPGSGTVWYDLVGQRNFNLSNGPTYDSSNGGCLVFDGVDDYAYNSPTDTTLGQFGSSTSFTVCTWIYSIDIAHPDSGNAEGRMCAKSGYPNSYWNIDFQNSSKAIQLEARDSNALAYSTSGTTSSSNAIVLNTWQYVNVVFDRNNLYVYFYVNGQSKGSQPINPSFVDINSTAAFQISSSFSEIGAKFGSFSMYNKALSASEIKQNYEAIKNRYI